MASLEKILTVDDLSKRHIVEINWCHMCTRTWNSVDHLLLHRETISAMWRGFFSWVGLFWIMPGRVMIYFIPREVWKMVTTCLIWCIWKEINDKNHEDRGRMLEDLKTFYFLFYFYQYPSTKEVYQRHLSRRRKGYRKIM